MDNKIPNHPNDPDFDDGIDRDDTESLQERIATMLDELSPHELDRIITDHVDYEAFASSQRAMLNSYYTMINARNTTDTLWAKDSLSVFVKSHCNILLTALEKACKDK